MINYLRTNRHPSSPTYFPVAPTRRWSVLFFANTRVSRKRDAKPQGSVGRKRRSFAVFAEVPRDGREQHDGSLGDSSICSTLHWWWATGKHRTWAVLTWYVEESVHLKPRKDVEFRSQQSILYWFILYVYILYTHLEPKRPLLLLDHQLSKIWSLSIKSRRHVWVLGRHIFMVVSKSKSLTHTHTPDISGDPWVFRTILEHLRNWTGRLVSFGFSAKAGVFFLLWPFDGDIGGDIQWVEIRWDSLLGWYPHRLNIIGWCQWYS